MSGSSGILVEKLTIEWQTVQWVAANRLDQFEYPEANQGIIEALNIRKMYSGNIVIHPIF